MNHKREALIETAHAMARIVAIPIVLLAVWTVADRTFLHNRSLEIRIEIAPIIEPPTTQPDP